MVFLQDLSSVVSSIVFLQDLSSVSNTIVSHSILFINHPFISPSAADSLLHARYMNPGRYNPSNKKHQVILFFDTSHNMSSSLSSKDYLISVG